MASLNKISDKYFGADRSKDYPIQDFASAYYRFIFMMIVNRVYHIREAIVYNNSPRTVYFSDGRNETVSPSRLISVLDLEQYNNIYDSFPKDGDSMFIHDTPERDIFQTGELCRAIMESLVLKMRILFNTKGWNKKPALSGGGLVAQLANKQDFVKEAVELYKKHTAGKTRVLSSGQAEELYSEIYAYYQSKYDEWYNNGQNTQLPLIYEIERQLFHNDNWENGQKYNIQKVTRSTQLNKTEEIIARYEKNPLKFDNFAPFLEDMAKAISYYNDYILPITGHGSAVLDMPSLSLEGFVARTAGIFRQELRKKDIEWLKQHLAKSTPVSLSIMKVKEPLPNQI